MDDLTLVGAGAVARALAARAREAGLSVAAWARRPEALGELDGVRPVGREALGRAPLLVLCVRDDALAEFARALAADLGPGHDGGGTTPVVLHTSGFHGSAPLEPLRARGRAIGWLHPLRSVPRGDAAPARRLDGAVWGVGGDPRAAEVARTLAARLGGRPLEVPESGDSKVRYHAAASLLAGGTAVLFRLAEELLAGAGEGGAAAGHDAGHDADHDADHDPHLARAVLAELVAGVVDSCAARGGAEALTGPAVRGDEGVVEAQLAALPPEARAVYGPLVEVMRRLRAAREDPGAPG